MSAKSSYIYVTGIDNCQPFEVQIRFANCTNGTSTAEIDLRNALTEIVSTNLITYDDEPLWKHNKEDLYVIRLPIKHYNHSQKTKVMQRIVNGLVKKLGIQKTSIQQENVTFPCPFVLDREIDSRFMELVV